MTIICIESYLLCSSDKLRSDYQIISLLAVIRSSLLPATLLRGFSVPRTALTSDVFDGSHLLEFLNLKIFFFLPNHLAVTAKYITYCPKLVQTQFLQICVCEAGFEPFMNLFAIQLLTKKRELPIWSCCLTTLSVDDCIVSCTSLPSMLLVLGQDVVVLHLKMIVELLSSMLSKFPYKIAEYRPLNSLSVRFSLVSSPYLITIVSVILVSLCFPFAALMKSRDVRRRLWLPLGTAIRDIFYAQVICSCKTKKWLQARQQRLDNLFQLWIAGFYFVTKFINGFHLFEFFYILTVPENDVQIFYSIYPTTSLL